jgi:hypothetical protein
MNGKSRGREQHESSEWVAIVRPLRSPSVLLQALSTQVTSMQPADAAGSRFRSLGRETSCARGSRLASGFLVTSPVRVRSTALDDLLTTWGL